MIASSRIRVLPVHVANKIAAGEVVDRPASLAKELVENAFDAGATQINVDIVAGGRKLVAVADNGCGMNRDDALLSIERHATSKISDVDDIERIATLGFRGEALAAIAAVSRFRMVTCPAGETTGTELVISAGKIQDVRDIGAPAGTSIEVRDLFFNVPARRKFLRSHPTELSHVRMTFLVQALSHPEKAMSLRVDGQDAYRLAAGSSIEDRIRDLFGAEFLGGLRPVQHDDGEVSVSGYVSLPRMTRADRAEQFVFVNGRATSAAVLSHAIREGYHAVLAPGRHPSVILFLSMDPGAVDVNVHPTKREVRFRHSGRVRDAVIAAVRRALGSPGIEAMIRPAEPEPAAAPRAAHAQLQIENLPAAPAFQYPRFQPLAGPETPDGHPVPSFAGSIPPPSPADAGDGSPRRTASAPWSWCRVVGQIGGLYVVLETDDGYVVMDPHAAHERILFDRYMAQVLRGKVETQGLLMPETVELSPPDALLVRKQLHLLKAMGFGISEFGGDSFLVDALPAGLSDAPASAILADIAQGLEIAGARGGKGRWREESIAQAACKAAVKTHDRLTLEEIEKLVVDLSLTDMPYTCPHGRPTLIFTSFRDLNKKFGRE